ncbi:hypothetical protein GIB67_033976 [Kingdonia uniflora]|uniref:Low-temperature-induced 65 kDa protein n=1 Tax=Kingdonia uniflora TaxID=39325 RepID=A0A7J7M5X8_9MAGN|nr:hypothetical protein GIB67_033976 [Kingdonia uniflora]
MAQMEKKYVKTYSGGTREVTMEQLLHGDDPSWPTTPSFGRNHDQEENHDHQLKKSVLAKVRDKAKKWKQTLTKKKHSHDENTTPAWGVSLDEDDDDDDRDNEVEDPEYYGAPMYESELAPQECKEMARQHPRADPVIPENHVLVSNINISPPFPKEQVPLPKEHVEEEKYSKTYTETVAKTLAPVYAKASETMTGTLAPVYAKASETTHMITSKIHDMAISTTSALASPRGDTSSGEQKWDKGVSMKEYLMHKFEPGEEEKALSEVISEAMSPRATSDNVGMVGKMRGAVSSFLGREDEPRLSIKMSTSEIPISTNSYEGIFLFF